MKKSMFLTLLALALAVCTILGMMVLSASAAEADHPHTESTTHCTCGGLGAVGDHKTCADVTWSAWTNGMTSPTKGNYYLAEDVTISSAITLSGNFKLCLNGYTLTVTGGARAFTYVYTGTDGKGYRTLDICDCSAAQSGKITTANKTNQGGVVYFGRGKFCLYGGTLENTADATMTGGVIRLGQKDDTTGKAVDFRMYGGKILGATTTKNGGAIYAKDADNNIKMYLYGGTVTGGSAVNGGNVYVGSGNLYLRETTISGGTATEYGGNVYCTGTMEMTGGWIYGGSADMSMGGDNVRVQNTAGSLTMSGGYIGEANQTADNAGHNLSLLNTSFTMNGGSIKGLVRANATTSASVNLSGSARITGAKQNLLISADAVAVTVGEMTDKANVGITLGASMTTNSFATATADPNGRINSDSKYYSITYADGALTRSAKTMLIGYSKVSIAPAAGTPLGGYGNALDRLSTGNDENYGLCATVVAITDSKDQTVLLITADLVNMPESVTAAAREAITAATGVPADHIMIAATHTHAAPDLTLANNKAINTYKAELYANLAAAAQAAIADQAAATAQVGSVEISGQSFIRHYTDAEGNYYGYEHWASEARKAGAVLTHAGEADCTMQLLKFDRGNKTPVVIANWQAHPHVLGNIDYASADFVGAFRNALGTAQGWNMAYFSGASGNVNPTSLVDTNNKTYITMGQAMAEVAAAAEFTGAGLDTIQTKQTKYAVTYKNVTEEQYNAAVAFLAGEDTGWAAAQAAGFNSVYEARSLVYVYENEPTTLELNAISLGNVAFVTAPYEMFDENGQTIQASNAHKMTFVLTQANGRNGYIPSDLSDKNIHETGVYELDSTRFVAGTGEELANAYLTMLRELVNEEYCICGGDKGGKPNHVCADVSWQAFPENGLIPTSGNFYLAGDLEISFTGTQACGVEGNLAIDLKGYTLTVIPANGGRVFGVSSGDNFSICDSVGGGQLVVSGETTQIGGLIFNNKGTVSIFGGTIDTSGLSSTKDAVVIRNAADSTCYIYAGTVIGGTTTANGGVISNAGTLNTYASSTIKGGNAAKGGNIYNTGTLRLTGKLTEGVAANGGNLYNGGTAYVYSRIGEGDAELGGNIYNTKTTLYLSGGEIRNAVNGGGIYTTANFLVAGAAKTVANKMGDKTVNVYLVDGALITAGSSATPLADGASIGITLDDLSVAFAKQTTYYADGVEAKDVFFCQDANCGIHEVDGKLYFQQYAARAYYKDGDEYKSQGYYTLEDAIAHEDAIYVALLADYTGDLRITSDLYLDLAGCSINGVVTVAEGATLYGMDSANDDYLGTCGKIAAINGNYASVTGLTMIGGLRRYVTIAEVDGISFHRYYAAVTAISLDPSNDALGYKAAIRGDEQVMSKVTGFGFHMWVEGGKVNTYLKTGSFADNQVVTLRLKNILAANGGEMNISAQAVVQFSHVDELAVGSKQTTTMKSVLQTINAAWEDYSEAQKQAVQTLCGKYDITKSWELNNILPTT